MKVAFFQKVMMHLSFPQTCELFDFKLENLSFGTEIWLEIKDVFKFDSLEAEKKNKSLFEVQTLIGIGMTVCNG